MKNKNIFLSLIILLGLLVFTACDDVEGELYQGEADKVSFLTTSTNLSMVGDYLEVPVGRTSTDGKLIVPVTLSAQKYDRELDKMVDLPGYTDAFKVVGDVTFEPGESKAYAKVDYSNAGTVDPVDFSFESDGYDVNVSFQYPITLTLSNEMLSPSNKAVTTISALSQLDFEKAGTGSVNGSWSGPIETVEYHKATAANVYKVISPYSEFNVAFIISSDGKSVTFPEQPIATHPSYGTVYMEVEEAVYNAELNAVIVDVSGYLVYLDAGVGSFGSGTEIFYLP